MFSLSVPAGCNSDSMGAKHPQVLIPGVSNVFTCMNQYVCMIYLLIAKLYVLHCCMWQIALVLPISRVWLKSFCSVIALYCVYQLSVGCR